MKKFIYRAALALLVLGSAPLLESCSHKTADPAPAPAPTAVLSGQVTPAGSVVTVTATNAAGVGVTATPDATGAYAFANLPLGAYILTFTPAAGYTQPAPVSVTLAAGGTTAPALKVTLAPASATITVNGGAAMNVPLMGMNVYATSGGATGPGHDVRLHVNPYGTAGPTVDLALDGREPQAGTHELNSYAYNAFYEGPDYIYYYTNLGATQYANIGTVTLTVNAAQHLFSGTFTFTGRDPHSYSPSGTLPPNTPPTVAVSGTFENLPY